MEAILFYLFAGMTVGLAMLVILQPNPIGAAIALVGSFFGVAALYVLMQAHFLAVMQILLYAGAIMVFFVFVVMLLNLDAKKFTWAGMPGSRMIGGLVATIFGGLLSFVVVQATNNGLLEQITDKADGSIEAVGILLFSKYVVPFEILSILLMVAIVGAVVMGKKEI